MFEVPEKHVAILSTYLVIPYENQLIKASKEKAVAGRITGAGAFYSAAGAGAVIPFSPR